MFFEFENVFLNLKTICERNVPYTQDVTSAIFDQAMFYADY